MSGLSDQSVISELKNTSFDTFDWSTTPLGPRVAWPAALTAIYEMMMASPFAMCVGWGPELTLIYNEAYRDFLAARHPAALGQPIREVWHDVWPAIAPMIAQVMAGEQVHHIDMPLVMTRKGYPEETYWTFAYSPLRDGDTVMGFLDIAFETTAGVLAGQRRDTAEASLRQLNDTLEQRVVERTAERNQLWQLSRDIMLRCGVDGRILTVNPAWTDVLGWSEDELIGLSVFDLIHPDDLEQSAAAARVHGQGQTFRRIDNRYRHKYGSYRWISWSTSVADNVIHAVGRDISVEKEREAILRDTQDFVRLALAAVGGVGVWTYDVASDQFRYDDAIAKLYAIDPVRGPAGISREEFLANVHPDDRPGLAATMSGGLVRSGDLELEYRLCHPDGSLHWVLSRGHTYHDGEGRPVRRTGVGVETTSQRQTEEALRQSQKMEAVGQLTGGVAHDFNNLLTIIRSSVDFLRRPDLPEARKGRYLDAVSDTVDRAAKLTGQLLAFARRQALKPEVLEVGALVHGIADMLDTLTGARVRVVTEVPDEPCFVRADRSQFETALINMAVNARDAMDGEGTLTLRLACAAAMPSIRGHAAAQGPFAAIALTDTGGGIAPGHLARIFEPFFTTKEVGKGTGLGLSQVFGFAKQSGGDVDVQSVLGQGTTFTLYLPEEAVQASPEPAQGDDEALSPIGEGQCVLVVEDNLEVGRFATQILEDFGYRTAWAANGEEALEKLGTDGAGFDVVFSDVVMPGMGGIAMAKLIRQRLPHLPVLLASGYSHVLAEEGSHGFDLLHKPYSAEQLARLLRRVTAPKGLEGLSGPVR